MPTIAKFKPKVSSKLHAQSTIYVKPKKVDQNRRFLKCQYKDEIGLNWTNSTSCACESCRQQTTQMNKFIDDLEPLKYINETDDFHKTMRHHQSQFKEYSKIFENQNEERDVKNTSFSARMNKELQRIQKVKVQSKNVANYSFSEQTFKWLVTNLAKEASEKVCGCQVPILTTMFFRPEKQVRHGPLKEKGCTRVSVYKSNTSTNQAQNGCFEKVRENIGANDAKAYCKGLILERNKAFQRLMTKQMVDDGADDLLTVQLEVINLSQRFYKDCYIVYYTDKTQKALNQVALEQEWNVKPNDIYWHGVECVQIAPLSKLGVGQSLKYNFSISKEKNFTLQFDYDYKALIQQKKTEIDLMKEDPVLFCRYVCLKIGYYLKAVCGQELVRMECEFFVDDFNQVFLVKANDIWTREALKMPTDHEKMFSQFLLKNQEQEKQDQIEQQQIKEKTERQERERVEAHQNLITKSLQSLNLQLPRVTQNERKALVQHHKSQFDMDSLFGGLSQISSPTNAKLLSPSSALSKTNSMYKSKRAFKPFESQQSSQNSPRASPIAQESSSKLLDFKTVMSKINDTAFTQKAAESQQYYKIFKKKHEMQVNKTLKEFAKARIFGQNESQSFASGLKLDQDSEDEQQPQVLSPFTPKQKIKELELSNASTFDAIGSSNNNRMYDTRCVSNPTSDISIKPYNGLTKLGSPHNNIWNKTSPKFAEVANLHPPHKKFLNQSFNHGGPDDLSSSDSQSPVQLINQNDQRLQRLITLNSFVNN